MRLDVIVRVADDTELTHGLGHAVASVLSWCLGEGDLLRMPSVLRWLDWVPYGRSDLYDMARELGVAPAHLPCLVLFGGSGSGTIVFPVGSADPAWFRGLFTEIHRDGTVRRTRPS